MNKKHTSVFCAVSTDKPFGLPPGLQCHTESLHVSGLTCTEWGARVSQRVDGRECRTTAADLGSTEAQSFTVSFPKDGMCLCMQHRYRNLVRNFERQKYIESWQIFSLGDMPVCHRRGDKVLLFLGSIQRKAPVLLGRCSKRLEGEDCSFALLRRRTKVSGDLQCLLTHDHLHVCVFLCAYRHHPYPVWTAHTLPREKLIQTSAPMKKYQLGSPLYDWFHKQ